jgi:hypothetical protein
MWKRRSKKNIDRKNKISKIFSSRLTPKTFDLIICDFEIQIRNKKYHNLFIEYCLYNKYLIINHNKLLKNFE